MLESVQKIKEIGLQAFVDLHHLNMKRHKLYPNLVLLKYDQIESKKNVPEIDECRGLILDEDNDYAVVSYPFKRFYNAHEGHAVAIDWESVTVQEKNDGSLCVLYWYDNKWNVQTSGTPDASGCVNDSNDTFHELFFNTWYALNYKLPVNTGFCYIFELMTTDNQVIVRHEKPRIVYIGCRNLQTLEEWLPIPPSLSNWEACKTYELSDMEAIEASLDGTSPVEREGVVCVDKNFNRIKIKSKAYVALHHLSDGLSSKRLLEIIRNSEDGEFISYFPRFKPEFDTLKEKYDALFLKIEQVWNGLNHDVDQKTFALGIKHLPFSSILFMLRAKKIDSIKHGLQQVALDSLTSWL